MANDPFVIKPPVPLGGFNPNEAKWVQDYKGQGGYVQYTDPLTGQSWNYGGSELPAAGSPFASIPQVLPQDNPQFNPNAPGGSAWQQQQWGGTAGPAGTGNSKTFGWQQPGKANYNPILADPWYIQQSGLLNAQWVAQQAQAQQKMQEALIGYGDTGAIQGENPWVTDLVRQLAKQNTEAGMSTLARIQHAADLARRNQINDLAARGMLQSGETGYQLGELGLQRQQTEYDSRRQLLEYLSGVQAALTQAGFQTQAGIGQAAFDAAQRQTQQQYWGNQ